MFGNNIWWRSSIRRIVIFAIIATTIISLTAAGSNAAVFSFMESVKEFLGRSVVPSTSDPDRFASGGSALDPETSATPKSVVIIGTGWEPGETDETLGVVSGMPAKWNSVNTSEAPQRLFDPESKQQPAVCVDVPYGVFTAAEIEAYYNTPIRPELSTKTPPGPVVENGIHEANILTIVLDFKSSGQGNTTDILGNVVGAFDPTAYGFVAGDFNTIANAVLAEVEQDYFSELAGTVAGPPGQDLRIDFILGDIGTPPPGLTNYYYMQIGSYVSGPNTGLGVAGVSVVRNSGGTGPNFGIVVGNVVGSIFTNNIQPMGGLTPSNALTSGNLGFTTFAIAGTTAHEAGHTLSLSHVNKAGSVQPTAVPPLMGTGAIDLPNNDRIYERTFSLSGNDNEQGGAAVFHIPQLLGAIGLHGGATSPIVTPPANQGTNEGTSTAVNLGSFADPDGDPWTVTVDWGDGSTDTTFNVAAAGSLGTQNHTWPDDDPSGTSSDPYTVTVTVTDSGAQSDSETFTMTVNNVAPSNVMLSLSATTINEGQSTSLSGSFNDLGTLDTHTVTINWGDGSAVQTVNLAAGLTTIPPTAHTYLDDNPTGTASDTYTITVTVADDDLGSVRPAEGGFKISNSENKTNVNKHGLIDRTEIKQAMQDGVPIYYAPGLAPANVGSDSSSSGSRLRVPSIPDAFGTSNTAFSRSSVTWDSAGVIQEPNSPNDEPDLSGSVRTESPTIVGPDYWNHLPTAGANVFPFNTLPASGKKIQWIVAPGEFTNPMPAPSGRLISALWFRPNAATNGTYTNLTIKMATVPASTFIQIGQYYSGPMTTLLSQNTTITQPTALEFVSIPLTTPFPYDPTMSLVIEVSQCGFTGTGFNINQAPLGSAPNYRRQYSDSSSACGVTPLPTGGDLNVPAFGLSLTTSTSINVTVNNVNPTATFTNGGPYVCGQDGAVAFSGQADPSAADLAGLHYSYDFDNNGTWEVGNGSYGGSGTGASATVPANPYLLPPGNHTVKGRVLDDDLGLNNYTTVITVNKANTTTNVTAVPAGPSVFGQSVTFTATVAVVAPGVGVPSGTVTFNIDGNLYCVNTPLVGLTATCTQAGLPALGAGLRNVVALYSGDSCFNGSAGTNNYTVNKADTITTILTDLPDPSLVGQPYTVTWSVVPNPVQVNSGLPTGTVTVNGGTGGGSCTAPVANGGCQLTPTTVGTKTIQATYNGDANFNTSMSATTTHDVNLQITGTVRNGLTLAPVAGHSVFLNICASATATTNAAGVYTFTGPFTGNCALFPSDIFSEPFIRFYNSVTDNITGADFLIFGSAANFPRKVSFPTQFVVPGAAGSMPVMMNSLGNEASISFSFTYDINPFAQPPTVVCGANAPGCTITQDNSIFGKVGVTITPAGGVFTRPDGTPLEGPEAPGPNEIARINFQTLATATMPSTDFTIGNSPTAISATETGTINSLLAIYVAPARIVFAHGLEGDVAGRNAGSGVVDSSDVVQVRRFVTGLDISVDTHNEYQRADVAPSNTKGDGTLNATDVIQTRRYGSGLDPASSAGGSGAAIPPPAAPAPEAAAAGGREVKIGSSNATNDSRVSIPVDLTANGDEIAASFTVRYDETRLTAPRVDLAKDAPEGMTLTVNTTEPGLIRVLVDSTTAIERNSKDASSLINITFDVTGRAPSGDTQIELDELSISDGDARSLTARATSGTISVSGPNPFDDTKVERIRRPTTPKVEMIEEWLNPTTVILRPRLDNEQPRTITRRQ